MSRRTDRVSQQVRVELARILREDSTDPRLRLVTLTRVRVSPDLGNAQVSWSSLSGDEEEAVARVDEALASASGFLRHRLAEALPLRRVPALHFRHDPSMALGAQTLEALRRVSHDASE
ncbi:MAG: 30S ribosome-binding factor RbfA [Myxococcota bacterium]